MYAASPCQPSTIAPASMEMMSPSLRTVLSSGMPWTTTSLAEVQMVAGNPPYPRKFDLAPWSAMTLRATSSRSLVVAPGTAASRVAAWIAATTSPASRIFAICSGVLISTMRLAFHLCHVRYGSCAASCSTVRPRRPADTAAVPGRLQSRQVLRPRPSLAVVSSSGLPSRARSPRRPCRAPRS